MRYFMDLTWLELAIWENDGGEGDEGGEGAGEGEGDEGGEGGEPDPKPKGKSKLFTQEEVDKMVVKRNKAVKAQLQSMEQQYEKLLNNSRLSEEQREELESDLESIRKQMRSKEEQLKHEKQQAEKKYTQQLEGLQKEAAYYRDLYENTTVQRALGDAAASGGAYEASQIVELLRGRTKLVADVDGDGNKLDSKVPMVEWTIKGEDGRQEVVLKRPEEVINAMKDDVKYQNLFKSNVVAGLGSSNAVPGAKGGRVDVTKMSPAEYAEFRKSPEGRKALGLK